MEQRVSVVVPIYNVENYLSRCINSIRNQSYTNLEILLVDDGSTDNSGNIADEFAALDKRIKVIHKNNGGLSDARNTGMEHITGEFTLFVDSDDWLDLKMIETLYQASQTFQADAVQSAFYYTYEDHLLLDQRYFNEESPPVILGKKELMKELIINEKVKNFAWGKLYKTKLIKDIPFKKGVLFEDVFWAHKVMHRVETYVILHQPLCYYVQRKDSIVATYTPKSLDMIMGLRERQYFIEEHYKEFSLDIKKVLLSTMLIHYNLLVANRSKDKDGRFRKEIQNEIKRNYKTYKKSVLHDRSLLQQLRLFSIHPYVNITFLITSKIVRMVNSNTTNTELKRVNL